MQYNNQTYHYHHVGAAEKINISENRDRDRDSRDAFPLWESSPSSECTCLRRANLRYRANRDERAGPTRATSWLVSSRSASGFPDSMASSAWKSNGIDSHCAKPKQKTKIPSRHRGHDDDNSSSQGSTQCLWNRCFPSHGRIRTSSPSSNSTCAII